MKFQTQENKYKWVFYLIMFLLAIPQFIYRFNHPHMTETELFFNFFKAYKISYERKNR